MNVREAMLARRSVRKYTEEPLTRAEIEELLHAAMSAPSAGNRRPWEYYVVTDEEKLAKLRKATPFSNIKAPCAIIVCGKLDRAFPGEVHSKYWVQDTSAATENILLTAVEMGLGTVWCGVHLQEKAEAVVSEILGLSENNPPLNIIYVGHPDAFPEARDQYEEELVHWD